MILVILKFGMLYFKYISNYFQMEISKYMELLKKKI